MQHIKFEQVLNRDEKIESYCKCSICLELFIDPICCENCENHYCSHCITTWSASQPSRSCPLCKSLKEKPAQRILKNMLASLQVTCANQTNGCEKILGYSEYFLHLKNCKYQIVLCQSPGCQVQTLLRDLPAHNEICLFCVLECNKRWCNRKLTRQFRYEHEELCDQRCVICEICSKEIKFNIFTIHQENCPEKKINCVECDQTILFKHRETHLEQECPNKKVDCKGCKKLFPRIELKNHTDNCPEIVITCLNCDESMKRSQICMHQLEKCVQNLKQQIQIQQIQLNNQQDEIAGLKLNILGIQQMMQNFSFNFKFTTYRFSNTYRHNDIEVINRGQSAIVIEQQVKDRFIFIEPDKQNSQNALLQIMLTFPQISDRFIAFGIADLSNLSHKKDYYKLNHLAYLFSANGVVYNSHAQDENGKKKDFKFEASHKLSLIYDPTKLRVTAQNMTTNVSYCMEISNSIIQVYGKSMFPVVCLRAFQDKVELLN